MEDGSDMTIQGYRVRAISYERYMKLRYKPPEKGYNSLELSYPLLSRVSNGRRVYVIV